jgi:hypothetical protein
MSAINTGSIDVTYPVPGVNNSSQGFRDNFTSIKNNLDIAGSEIGDLQSKSIVKSGLTGISLDNNMNNTLISNALTQGFRQTTYNLGNNLSGTVNLNCENGDVQYGTLTGNITLGFSGFAPAGTWSVVQAYLIVNSANYTIGLPSSVSIGVKTLENYVSTGSGGNIRIQGSLGADSPSIVHLLFATKDCGINIEVIPVNRPRKATQITNTVPASSIGSQGDRAGAIAADANYIYVCTADYNGSTSIWKRAALGSF